MTVHSCQRQQNVVPKTTGPRQVAQSTKIVTKILISRHQQNSVPVYRESTLDERETAILIRFSFFLVFGCWQRKDQRPKDAFQRVWTDSLCKGCCTRSCSCRRSAVAKKRKKRRQAAQGSEKSPTEGQENTAHFAEDPRWTGATIFKLRLSKVLQHGIILLFPFFSPSEDNIRRSVKTAAKWPRRNAAIQES